MKEKSKLQGSHQEKVRMKKIIINLCFVVGNNNNNFILCTKIQNLNSLPRNLRRTLLKATLEDRYIRWYLIPQLYSEPRERIVLYF